MSRRSLFRVAGRLDRAGGSDHAGTVSVTRGPVPIFEVRPLRSRKVYALPLSTVADMIVLRVVRADLARAALEKANKAKARKVERRLQRVVRGGR